MPFYGVHMLYNSCAPFFFFVDVDNACCSLCSSLLNQTHNRYVGNNAIDAEKGYQAKDKREAKAKDGIETHDGRRKVEVDQRHDKHWKN